MKMEKLNNRIRIGRGGEREKEGGREKKKKGKCQVMKFVSSFLCERVKKINVPILKDKTLSEAKWMNKWRGIFVYLPK